MATILDVNYDFCVLEVEAAAERAPERQWVSASWTEVVAPSAADRRALRMANGGQARVYKGARRGG